MITQARLSSPGTFAAARHAPGLFHRLETPAAPQRPLIRADGAVDSISRRHAIWAPLLAMLGPTTFGLPAQAEGADSATSFYSQWPYVHPVDILPFLHATCKPGDADTVLAAIDQFAAYYPFYRSGPEKGRVLEELVAAQEPPLALELGTFMGYGTIRIARALSPGGRVLTIEADTQQAAVAREVLSLAGLGPPRVQVLHGLSSLVLPRLAAELPQGPGRQLGFVFLDHCKPCYLPDLQAMEALGLVAEGTVVVADNVIFPGTPSYLQHVQAPEGAVVAAARNAGAQPVPPGGRSSRGRDSPSIAAAQPAQLLYDTRLVEAAFEVEQRYKEGWQPQRDALAVSYCLGPAPEQQLPE